MPCVAEMPHLVQVAQEFAADGGAVIGVSEDLFAPRVTPEQALARVREFAARRRVPFPLLVFDDTTLDGLNALLDLPGPIPATIAVDAAGREVDREEGDADLDRLREMMRRALGR
jgi:thiol-disulfide isomerase/thioredoxin